MAVSNAQEKKGETAALKWEQDWKGKEEQGLQRGNGELECV